MQNKPLFEDLVIVFLIAVLKSNEGVSVKLCRPTLETDGLISTPAPAPAPAPHTCAPKTLIGSDIRGCRRGWGRSTPPHTAAAIGTACVEFVIAFGPTIILLACLLAAASLWTLDA